MKRIVTFSLFAAIAGLYACSPTPYDADPKKDQASVINPFDPTITFKTLIGTMQGRIDGKERVLKGWYEVNGETGTRVMYARVIDDSMFFRTIHIVGADDNFKGKKNEDVTATIRYTTYDTAIKRNKIFEKQLMIPIFQDANNTSLGMIHGTLSRVEPPPADPNDIVRIDSMIFYLEKK